MNSSKNEDIKYERLFQMHLRLKMGTDQPMKLFTIPPDHVLIYVRNSPGSMFDQSLPYISAVIHRDNFGPDHIVHKAEAIVDEYRYWRARPPHASATRNPEDGYAFAAAWEQSER